VAVRRGVCVSIRCAAVRVYSVGHSTVTGIYISTARDARRDRVTHTAKSHDVGADAAAEGQVALVGAGEVGDPFRSFHTLIAYLQRHI
jgi:uncharacterized protein YigE (DUF2233 family)